AHNQLSIVAFSVVRTTPTQAAEIAIGLCEMEDPLWAGWMRTEEQQPGHFSHSSDLVALKDKVRSWAGCNFSIPHLLYRK
ncbi:mCG146010, partial [Mus musculus]